MKLNPCLGRVFAVISLDPLCRAMARIEAPNRHKIKTIKTGTLVGGRQDQWMTRREGQDEREKSGDVVGGERESCDEIERNQRNLGRA